MSLKSNERLKFIRFFYEVEYKEENDTEWISGSNTTADTFDISGLLPATIYNWRVRSDCDFDNHLPCLQVRI